MAQVPCTQILDFLGIATLAGSSGDETIRFDGSFLYVSDVTQDALEQAFANFDPLPAAKLQAMVRINAAYESEFSAIKAQYPESERESWSTQVREASRLADDPLFPTPYIDALLTARGFGETKAELVAKVQEKNQTYSALSASLTGKRHALERQVSEATTIQALDSIVW